MDKIKTIRNEEAMAFLRSLSPEDAITKSLVNNAMFHFTRRFHSLNQRPAADFDLMYFLEIMRDIFSQHDVLRRILAGESVGAFCDEE